MPSSKPPIIFLALLCILIIATHISQINKPFWGHHEFNGVFYSQIARNYLRYGIVKTKGGQVTNANYLAEQKWHYHLHHPAIYPLMLSLSFKTFGTHEWVARSASILATLVGFVLLAVLVKNYWALLPILFSPLVLYYGRLPVFEPFLLPLTVLVLITYTKKHYWGFMASALALILFDWPGYWPVFVIFLFELASRKKDIRIIAYSLASLILGTGLILAHQTIVSGHPLKDLIAIGDFRLFANPYNSWQWVSLLISRIKAFYGVPIIIFSAIGFLVGLFNKKEGRIMAISFIVAISHIIVFRNITWYHDYMLYHAIPYVAISLGLSLDYLQKKFNFKYLPVFLSIILTISTYMITHKFFHDLFALEQHRDCVEGTAPEEKDCGAFHNFYFDEINTQDAN